MPTADSHTPQGISTHPGEGPCISEVFSESQTSHTNTAYCQPGPAALRSTLRLEESKSQVVVRVSPGSSLTLCDRAENPCPRRGSPSAMRLCPSFDFRSVHTNLEINMVNRRQCVVPQLKFMLMLYKLNLVLMLYKNARRTKPCSGASAGFDVFLSRPQHPGSSVNPSQLVLQKHSLHAGALCRSLPPQFVRVHAEGCHMQRLKPSIAAAGGHPVARLARRDLHSKAPS